MEVIIFSWIVIFFSFAYLVTIYQIIVGILTPHNCKLIPPGGDRRDVIVKGSVFLGGITLLLMIVSLIAYIFGSSQSEIDTATTSTAPIASVPSTPQSQPNSEPEKPTPSKSLEEQFNEKMADLRATELAEANAAVLEAAALKASARQRQEADATELCKSFAKTSANYPDTFKIPFLGVETVTLSSGQIRVFVNFTAKNAFGEKLKFRATCQFMEGAEPNFVIEPR